MLKQVALTVKLIILILFLAVCVEGASPPCVLVIFGATGDLATQKLLPAIRHLKQNGHLSEQTVVLGCTRKQVPSSPEEKLFYHQLSFEDARGYQNLHGLLSKIDAEFGTQGNRLFYFATPPKTFPALLENLHQHQLIYPADDPHKWSRVIIEKPFGTDLASACQLQELISSYLDAAQIFRMDHYLGKPGVYSLPLLCHYPEIDHIQITLSEEIGVGARGAFWEETGALRDLFQNHALQVLMMLARGPSGEKAKILRAAEIAEVVRGQYSAGRVRGEPVLGYREERGVAADSCVETYVAAQLWVHTPEWEGVPFYIRVGKRLAQRVVEVAIVLKGGKVVFLRIQPDRGIYCEGERKKGEEAVFEEAYERLIYDALCGDQRLFVHWEEQLEAWRLVTPILEQWGRDPSDRLFLYEAGSWGPPDAWPPWQICRVELIPSR